MIKKTILFLLCFLANVSTLLWCRENAPGASSLTHLFNLASKNFVFSGVIPENSIIDFVDRLEAEALEEKDCSTYFKVAQIKVNTYCLKEDIGLAADEAKHLYERAKALRPSRFSRWVTPICTWNSLSRHFPLSRKRKGC